MQNEKINGTKNDEEYMKQALTLAREASQAGEVPVGAVVVWEDENGKEVFSHEYTYAGKLSLAGLMEGYLYETADADAGEYDIAANVSNGTSAGTLELSLDGKALASLAFTGVTDDWDTYEEATGKATLTKGEHTLRITIANDNTNVDYVKFSLPGASTNPGTDPGTDPGTNPGTDPGEDPLTLAKSVSMNGTSHVAYVFDMQGRSLGRVTFAYGTSLNDAIFAKFGKAGVYMVRIGSKVKSISVTR